MAKSTQPLQPSQPLQPLAQEAQVEPLSAETAISQLDLLALNTQPLLSQLRFCASRDSLIPVLEVLKIHSDGKLDLQTSAIHKPSPTGMKASLPFDNSPKVWMKVRRDDSGKEAGTYKILI